MRRTRREVLAAAPAVLGSLSGCADGSWGQSDQSVEATDGAPSAANVPGRTRDPSVTWVRNTADGHVLDDEEGDPYAIATDLVADEAGREALAFADGVPDAEVEAAEGFLDETDFGTETVYLLHAQVESCKRYRLQSISWTAQKVEYEYCWELRPPDEACEADDRDWLLGLVRIPAALDPNRVTRSSSSGGGCRRPDADYETIDPEGDS